MMIQKQTDTVIDQDHQPSAQLRTDIKLILHTRVAQSLFNGA